MHLHINSYAFFSSAPTQTKHKYCETIRLFAHYPRVVGSPLLSNVSRVSWFVRLICRDTGIVVGNMLVLGTTALFV